MSISHLFEDFGAYAKGNPISLTDISLEEQRLEAFEKGYQAGWDDAVQAQSDDTRHVSAEFAQNMQDLSFTYHEAYAAVLDSFKPLLQQVVNVVLPHLAQQTLGLRLTDLLDQMARAHGPQTVELITAPANFAMARDLSETTSGLSLSVSEEPTLAEGQVYLRFGQTEQEIDLREVIEEIDRSVSDFFEGNQKESA